ncbi:MAG: hypothetical protein P8Z70_01225 [Desulfuromonadales bacterium]
MKTFCFNPETVNTVTEAGLRLDQAGNDAIVKIVNQVDQDGAIPEIDGIEFVDKLFFADGSSLDGFCPAIKILSQKVGTLGQSLHFLPQTGLCRRSRNVHSIPPGKKFDKSLPLFLQYLHNQFSLEKNTF